MAEAFEKVTIISQAAGTDQQRAVPANVEVRSIPIHLSKIERMEAIAGRFSSAYRTEKRYLRDTCEMEMNLAVLKTFLISFRRAKKFEKLAEALCLEFDQYANYLYSYWSDDCAIGLALFRASHPEVRSFSRVHGWDVYFEASAIGYLPMRAYISDHLDAIFAISQTGKNYCENRWKVKDSAKIHIARLGISHHDYHLDYQEPFTIVSCANLIPLKRIHLLIDALALMKVKKQIRWVHFGSGPLADVLKLRAAEKIPEQIEVEFAGHISNSALMDWYAECRPAVFVNTSSTEGIPVSIMEAMSFGTPVIATNVGGTSEIVNTENGVLVDANVTPEMLCDQLQKMVELSSDRHRKLREGAYQTWFHKYNAAANYQHFIEQIERL